MSKSWKDLSDNAKRIVQQGNTGGTLPVQDWVAVLKEVVDYGKKGNSSPLTIFSMLVGIPAALSQLVLYVGGIFAGFVILVGLGWFIFHWVDTGSLVPEDPSLLYIGPCLGLGWLLLGYLPSRWFNDVRRGESQRDWHQRYGMGHVLLAVLDFLEMLQDAGSGAKEVEIEFFLKVPIEGKKGERLQGKEIELEELPKERVVSLKMPIGNHSQFAAEIHAPVRMAAVLASYQRHLEVFLLTVEATLRADAREFVRADRLPYMVGLHTTEEAILLDTVDVQPLDSNRMEETNGLRVVYREMLEAVTFVGPPPLTSSEG